MNRRVRVTKKRAAGVDSRVVDLQQAVELKDHIIDKLRERLADKTKVISQLRDRDKTLYDTIAELRNKLGDMRRQASHQQNKEKAPPVYGKSTYKSGYASRLNSMKEYAKKHGGKG